MIPDSQKTHRSIRRPIYSSTDLIFLPSFLSSDLIYWKIDEKTYTLSFSSSLGHEYERNDYSNAANELRKERDRAPSPPEQ